MENLWLAGMSTGWHTHPKGQLLYATKGVMLVQTDTASWVVPPNRALWMHTGTRHTVTMSGDVLMRTAYINVEHVPSLPLINSVINVSPLLRELLVAAVHIDFHTEPTGRDARLLSLLIDEIRVSTTLPMHLPMPQDERLRNVCDRICANPWDASSAIEWARSIHIGERTLHRLFAKEAGMTFAQWREQARLLHALHRIASGDKILSVALDCGYGSASAFAAMFRRHFGASPSSFYE